MSHERGNGPQITMYTEAGAPVLEQLARLDRGIFPQSIGADVPRWPRLRRLSPWWPVATSAWLVESVAAWAASPGAATLVLDVVADDGPAIALYERAGFRRFDGEGMGELAPGELRFTRPL